MTSVPLVTMATQNNLVDSVCHASATATSTLKILGHVIPEQANASSACTTPTAHHVTFVSMVTMATLWPTTAGVSVVFSFEEKEKHAIIIYCCFTREHDFACIPAKHTVRVEPYCLFSVCDLNMFLVCFSSQDVPV